MLDRNVARHKTLADGGGYRFLFYCDVSGAHVCTTKEVYHADSPEAALLAAWETEGRGRFNKCHKCGRWVIEAVYKRATGYNVSTKKTHKLKRVDFDPVTGKKLREYEELAVADDEDYVPPDLRASIFWLKNRQPERWSEKVMGAEISEGGIVEIPQADAIDPTPLREGEEPYAEREI